MLNGVGLCRRHWQRGLECFEIGDLERKETRFRPRWWLVFGGYHARAHGGVVEGVASVDEGADEFELEDDVAQSS